MWGIETSRFFMLTTFLHCVIGGMWDCDPTQTPIPWAWVTSCTAQDTHSSLLRPRWGCRVPRAQGAVWLGEGLLVIVWLRLVRSPVFCRCHRGLFWLEWHSYNTSSDCCRERAKGFPLNRGRKINGWNNSYGIVWSQRSNELINAFFFFFFKVKLGK